MAETVSATGAVIAVCRSYQGRNERISKASDLSGSSIMFLAMQPPQAPIYLLDFSSKESSCLGSKTEDK